MQGGWLAASAISKRAQGQGCPLFETIVWGRQKIRFGCVGREAQETSDRIFYILILEKRIIITSFILSGFYDVKLR